MAEFSRTTTSSATTYAEQPAERIPVNPGIPIDPSGALPINKEAHSSGVSWGSVIGGAFVIAALYLILLALGAGFGLSAVSPWSSAGISASTVGAAAIVWLIFIEIVSSAFGGYLTGRLRTKWAAIHSDEVFFRDTANGFLSWTVALVVSAGLLGSAAASMAGSSPQFILPTEASSMMAAGNDPDAYFVDRLFRADARSTSSAEVDPASQGTAIRLFANALRQNQMTASDRTYLAQLISARTGVSRTDAEKRVMDAVSEALGAEDAARRATAHLLLWLFVSLLLGAFSASFAATIGGRQRDHLPAVHA